MKNKICNSKEKYHEECITSINNKKKQLQNKKQDAH